MTQNTVPLRGEIPEQYTWNAPSVFPSYAEWEEELARVLQSLDTIKAFQGQLGNGPTVLADAVDKIEALYRRLGKVSVYAYLHHAVDLGDQTATAAVGKARSVFGQVLATTAFLDPELLSIGEDTLRTWIAEEPRLTQFAHYIDDLFRKQAHVRSAEVEELLGMLADPFGSTGSVAEMLTDADFHFAPATASDGSEWPLTQGTLQGILASSDREARRTAWENYTDQHLAFKNTLAANLATSIKQNVFRMRARRYESTLEAALFQHNIPTSVFHNLIDTFRANLPTWHRYWAIRRKALGVDTLQPYDIWAPLSGERPHISYEQAVDMICAGLAPMGEEYVQIVRRGCLEDRWVDVYPNQGKGAGAFSAGQPGTFPFIVMNYNSDVFSLSTLAHELGHSMHSYLTWEHQPIIYSDYSLFVAEVASNFHQALVRAHLLETQSDPAFQINVIEEAISNFHRYFFIMPTLARFELAIHQRVERGQGLTADDMNALMADLFSEGYGGEMHVDRDRVGITWATFGHLYVDYYVYQYATGLSGANALAQRVLSGGQPAVEDYLGFLKTGSSRYPLDVLARAGVDLTTPDAVEVTFGVLASLVDKLEALI
ncbi:MAG: oligoendopeptidase F [Anaerolineae bacterium]